MVHKIFGLMALTILVAFVFTTNGQIQNPSFNQKVTMYAQKRAQGQYLNLVETFAPNLRNNNFDKRAQSVCLTGAWLFYQNPNYNTGARAQMEYAFYDALTSQNCMDLEIVPGKSSSVRFAGFSRDYRQDSITLYEGTYFMGQQDFVSGDAPTLRYLDRRASSFIVTGVSAWTLYDNIKFQGESLCVYPPRSNNFAPNFLVDTTSIKVPHGTIRSIRKGCWSRTGPRSVDDGQANDIEESSFGSSSQSSDE